MIKSGLSKRFIYIVTIITGIALMAPSLTAQVDQSELGNLGPVEFINYEGPYSIFETRAQIRAIGYTLGQAVRAGQARAGSLGRYFVTHASGPQDGSKLEADIFGLGVDVGVDHIRNLRFILMGYLEAAYDYNDRDAFLLAEYITVYNAVYRGDLDFFTSRYIGQVMDNLTRERAGLSVRFDEWPGQTQIIIPLGSGLGGQLSSIDTGSLIDPRVTEQLREEPDMAIDQRRAMVDLLERESDQAAQTAAAQREAARQEEERIARERAQAGQQQQEAQREREQVAQERQQPGADQAALDQRDRAALESQQQAQQQQEELDRQQQAVEERRQEAERQDAFAEQRADEAQEQRRQIAQDQQALMGQAPGGQSSAILGTSILTPIASLGRVVLLDADTGNESRRSAMTTINTRTVTRINDKIIAIAGEDRGSGAIRLIEIDGETLEMVKQGDDNIAPQSLLWNNGQDLFAVVSSDGRFYMARFNTDLVLQSRSSITVHDFASLLFSGNYIATQREDGSAVLLNPRDLSERR